MDDLGTPGTFATVGAIQSTSLSINNEQVDVTTKTDGPWRNLIACGIQSMSISGAGVFTDDAKMSDVQTKALDGGIVNFRIISGNGDSFTGPFQISTFERSGDFNTEEKVSVSLESAAEIIYVAP